MEAPGKKTSIPPRKRKVLLALGWYAGQIHGGVSQFAREAGWLLNVDMMRSGTIPETWRGDGIIAILGSKIPMDRALRRMNLPLVNIGPAGGPGVPTVLPDNAAIARLAAEHYLRRGFRHFAFYRLSGGPGGRLRYQAFRDELARHGRSLHLLDWPLEQKRRHLRSEQSRQNWIGRSLLKLPKPLALFAEFDDAAVQVLQACEAFHVSVPEQVAVLGVDNDVLQCDFAPIPLSSIDDNQHGQGYAACLMLQQLMSGHAPKASTVLVPPGGVITRQSSDILAVEHPYVASALRRIWEDYTRPINAADVAEHIPMSSRRLHDAFVRHVGHSISDEIARKRIEHVQHLLETTSMKLHQVAELSGFASADNMSKVFLRMVKMTPSAYRRQRPAKR